MFFEDYSEKISQTQASSQPVSLVDISKKFPRTLIVTFQQEAAAYTVIFNGETTVISQSGKMFANNFETTPPIVVEALENINAENRTIESSIHHTVLSILATASELKLPLTKITWVDKSTIRLSMENRAETFILDSEKPALELNRLSLVLKSGEYKNISEQKTELDLRFAMPVLRTQP